MSEHRFTLDHDLDELVEAYLTHRAVGRKALKPWKIFLLTFGIAAAVVLVLSYKEGALDLQTAALAFGVAALLAVAIRWPPERLNRPSLQRYFGNQWKEMGLGDGQTTYRFDGHQLVIEDECAGGRITWDRLFGWTETDRFILIYRSREFYYYIAKSKVDTPTLAALKACLVASPARVL